MHRIPPKEQCWKSPCSCITRSHSASDIISWYVSHLKLRCNVENLLKFLARVEKRKLLLNTHVSASVVLAIVMLTVDLLILKIKLNIFWSSPQARKRKVMTNRSSSFVDEPNLVACLTIFGPTNRNKYSNLSGDILRYLWQH